MTIQLEQPAVPPEQAQAVARRLLVIWQNRNTHIYTPVAQLQMLLDGTFQFSYLPRAAGTKDFYPLDEYPDLDSAYYSPSLPAFFANRVMSTERENYLQYLAWLGLSELVVNELPIEVLVRTGGGRATDTFHIVEEPDLSAGSFVSRFFISGLVHADPSLERVRHIKAGSSLILHPDPENEVNSRAILLDVRENEPIGWVPDWLCGQLVELEDQGFELRAEVEHVNVDAPAHIRVLCRVEGVLRRSLTSS